MNLKFDGENQLQQLVSTGGRGSHAQTRRRARADHSSRELTAKFDGTGQWTTIDQTGTFISTMGSAPGREIARTWIAPPISSRWTARWSLPMRRRAPPRNRRSFTQGSNTSACRRSRADHRFAPPRTGSISNSRAGARARFRGASGRGHGARARRVLRKRQVVAGTIRDRGRHDRTGQPDAHSGGEGTECAEYSPRRRGIRSRERRRRPSRANRQDRPSNRASAGQAGACLTTQLGHVRGGLLTYWETESRARIEQNAQRRLRARLDPSQSNRSIFFRRECRKRHQTAVALGRQRGRDRPSGRPPGNLGPGRIHGFGRQVCSFRRVNQLYIAQLATPPRGVN